MSKRLQVLVDEAEYQQLRRAAKRRGITVSDWVRQVLRSAARAEPAGSADRKLATIRAAARHAFPTADVTDMLAEIERGYATALPE
jgi:negative regulator of replication initiation